MWKRVRSGTQLNGTIVAVFFMVLRVAAVAGGVDVLVAVHLSLVVDGCCGVGVVVCFCGCCCCLC